MRVLLLVPVQVALFRPVKQSLKIRLYHVVKVMLVATKIVLKHKLVAHGTADTTVNTCYNQQNANGFAALYGVNQLSGTTTISDDATRTAEQSHWQDNRVAMLWLNNLDHSWSGGQGASGDYCK